MVRFFIGAGRRNGVRPSDIVGAIANEAGVPGHVIGAIDIYDDFTFAEVPVQYRDQVLTGMSGATIRNREADIHLATAQDVAQRRLKRRSDAPGGAMPRRRPSGQPQKREARRSKKAGRDRQEGPDKHRRS